MYVCNTHTNTISVGRLGCLTCMASSCPRAGGAGPERRQKCTHLIVNQHLNLYLYTYIHTYIHTCRVENNGPDISEVDDRSAEPRSRRRVYKAVHNIHTYIHTYIHTQSIHTGGLRGQVVTGTAPFPHFQLQAK